MDSARLLLTSLIDYAGLFPPAALAMASAVSNYADYRQSDDAWALARFVVPCARLGEFEEAANAFLARDPGWHLSVLTGPNLNADIAIIRDFNHRHRASALIGTAEVKASTAAAIERSVELLPSDVVPYFEIPVSFDPVPLIAAVGRCRARAKIRTGGVTPEAIPPTTDVARFITACHAAKVPFKATAGLHHPVRGAYRLTYEPDSAAALMHGFLNIFVAAAHLEAGLPDSRVLEVVEESSSRAFRFHPNGIDWRGHWISNSQIAETRQCWATTFGSCSFEEPLHELRQIHIL